MFKTKKYKLTFDKKLHYVGPGIGQGIYKEVEDHILLSKLLELQKKYDFKIINTKFHTTSNNEIIIRCKKEDKIKIFSEYCLELGKYIQNFKF